MKNFDEHIDLIERYLYDDMTQEELEEFNGLLRKDPEFNKLFYEMDHLLEGIRRSAKLTTVEEKLARLERSLPHKEKSIESEVSASVIPIWGFVKNYKMAIAASISLIFAVTIVFTNIKRSKSPDELFTEYFTEYESINGVVRGKNDIEKLQYAMIAYEQANYEKAINIFEQIVVTDENKIQIWLYSGNSYLILNHVNEAKACFNNIIEANIGFEMDAKWYLSLCYLKEGEVEQAKPLLRERIWERQIQGCE